MNREKVKIKFVLTIMALAVFGGINTAAAVINQWMQKPIAPQLLVIDQSPGDFKIKLAGYQINHIIDKSKKSMVKVNNYLCSFSKLIMQEAKSYWNRLQSKFFFKDKWKSAILDIA